MRALDGVDLEVREGTVLGLLGPNGAGKTTTVRILATLLRPDAGRATVAGLDVVRDAQAVRSVIGLSGQYAAVDENLTGRENLWMFGRLYQLAARGGDAGGPTSCSSSSISRTPPIASRRRTRAACAAGSISPPRSIGRPQAPVPRRADDRSRPAQPARHVGRHPRPGARGHHAAPDDAVPRGGGRARRRDRRRRPRQDHRPRHGGRAQGTGRRRAHRGRRPRPRAALPRPPTLVAPDGDGVARRAHEAAHDRGGRRRAAARRRRPVARRRGHRARRRRAAPPDARRRVPRADRTRGGGALRRGEAT